MYVHQYQDSDSDSNIDDDSYPKGFCQHGYRYADCAACDALDDEIESKGGIDKCLCCGKYKYGNSLNAFQQCIKGCRNPNEY